VTRAGGGAIDMPEQSLDIPEGQELTMMFDL